MDKTIRIFQFILMIIFLMFQNIIKIGFQVIFFISIFGIMIIFVASSFGSNMNLLYILNFVYVVIGLLAGMYILEKLSEYIGSIFGIFLGEKEEHKKMNEEYERWYEGINKKYYSYNNSYYNHSYKKEETNNIIYDNVIIKYEEYLKYLGINIENNITLDEIKKSYKYKMKKVHPDVNKSSDATIEASKLNSIKDYLYINFEYYMMERGK